jgi:hypothetical protein
MGQLLFFGTFLYFSVAVYMTIFSVVSYLKEVDISQKRHSASFVLLSIVWPITMIILLACDWLEYRECSKNS